LTRGAAEKAADEVKDTTSIARKTTSVWDGAWRYDLICAGFSSPSPLVKQDG
jgi:hypothetical protein